MTRRVLILGGTAEARVLAELLAAEARFEVTTSLAGRTPEPRLPAGQVRVGGFGGPEGLAGWLREQQADVVIDATHPFAEAISRHAALAARAAGVPLLALRRPGWSAGEGDRWHWADTLAAAAALLPGLGHRPFLTVGRQDLAAFAGLRLHCLARSIAPPPPPLPVHCRILLDRGPFTLDAERALFREHRVDVLVTKDSGGPATAAKLTAAREAALPVLIIRRPPSPPGVPTVASPPAALQWLHTR